MDLHYDTYTWIFAVSTIVSFACAFGIGANDVANSFGSSVGAKALTIGQAVLVAAVCEFSGAMGLGAGVTSTIKSGIADVTKFQTSPDLLMYGFLCVMVAAAFWDNLACQLELPVSTTHTTVGAIVGMAIAIRGANAVIWSRRIHDFPYLEGMTPIFLSWIVSPILAGICVLILFGFIRTFILRSRHSFTRGFYLLPAFVALTFFIIVLFIIQTGNKNASWDKVSDGKAVWISVACAVPLGVLTLLIVMPILRRAVNREEDEMNRQKAIEEGKMEPGGTGQPGMQDVNLEGTNSTFGSRITERWRNFSTDTKFGRLLTQNPITRAVTYGSTYEVHGVIGTDVATTAVWEHAEVFDYKTERLFRYLQVFSAMVVSFAHGSNDVANAVGPYAAIYAIWRTQQVPKKAPVPQWIYALGGAGIVLGLATFGYKIMRVLGVKVAKLTNSRGFSAELSTAVVVLLASRYGLPVSTTQVITGAILAIGLFEGFRGVNWLVLLRTFFGWVLTLIIAGVVAGLLASFGVYGASKVASDDINAVNKVLFGEITSMVAQLNSSAAGLPALSTQLQAIQANLTNLRQNNTGYAHPRDVVQLQQYTFNLFNSTLAG